MQQLPTPFVAATFAALLIASWGVTSYVTNTDVISEKDAGPLLGPCMALAAILVVLAWIVRVRKGGSVPGAAVAAAASTWFALLVTGSVGYMVTRGELAWMLLFAGKYAASPYVLLPVVLAAGVVAVTGAVRPRANSFAPPTRGE